MGSNQNSSRRVRNLSIAAIAGQAGVSTVLLVIGALLLGLWLDSLAGLRGPFTIGLVVLSVPLSLLVMLRTVLAATRAIQPPARHEDHSTTTKED